MKICGDLLRLLSIYLKPQTKLKVLYTCKQIRNNCIRQYDIYSELKKVWIPYDRYVWMPKKLHSYVRKINDVRTIAGLHDNITHIHVHHKYNKFTNTFPKNLIWIEFGDKFNKHVKNLPDTIQIMKFGQNFRKYIKVLPHGLNHLDQ